MKPVPVSPDIIAFLDRVRSRVHPDDIRENILNDPGGADYFERWNSLRLSKEIPTPDDVDFDLTEGMYSLAVTSARTPQDQGGMLAFRRFTHAICLALVVQDCWVTDEFIPFNYLCLNLIRDLDVTDPSYLKSLRLALAAVRERYPLSEAVRYSFEEFPFLLLAEILLAQRDDDHEVARVLADELIVANTHLKKWGPCEFLYGLTSSNRLHAEWHREVRSLQNPTGDFAMTELIRLLRAQP